MRHARSAVQGDDRACRGGGEVADDFVPGLAGLTSCGDMEVDEAFDDLWIRHFFFFFCPCDGLLRD